MRRPTLIIAALIGAALFLSACDFSGSIRVKPTPDATVTSGSAGDAVRTFVLQSGQHVLVRVDLSSQARSSPLLQIELSEEIDLEVLRDGGARYLTLASSSSREFFGPGSAGIAPASFSAQAINNRRACGGSCVILRRDGEGPYFARITNDTSSNLEVALFAFGVDFADEHEVAPSNDTAAGAARLPLIGDFDEGAIETIGDVDYWLALERATFAFSFSNRALELMAYIETSEGIELPINPGEDQLVLPGEFIRIESAAGRAAAPGQSAYIIEMFPPAVP